MFKKMGLTLMAYLNYQFQEEIFALKIGHKFSAINVHTYCPDTSC